MRAVDIIQKKRDKIEITEQEIKFLLDGYLKGIIPDYQMSAFLMAVFFNGMKKEELKSFTETMMNSGDIIDFKGINKFLIDKHSTGGVGDKTTIALAPIFAAFDIGTAKLSGRGLGHTGGTIDKFEAIPGFKFPETKEELIKIINNTGTGVMGYSDKIVPLDKMLYGLRDVTATVQSIPLIASSIMSKKLAVYADGIILDVKVGSGAFMKSYEEACNLADVMLEIGKSFGRKVIVIMTDMDQPLGKAVGNSLEVIEAIETLKGRGPEDFTLLVETIAAIGLMQKGDTKNIDEGIEKVKKMIETGKPIEMLKKFIKGCNGDERVVDDYSLFKVTSKIKDVFAEKTGYISHLEAEKVGKAAMVLGAGRAKKDDEIDHSVGIVIEKKVGDYVKEGEILAKIYYNGTEFLESSVKIIQESMKISHIKSEKRKVIVEIRE